VRAVAIALAILAGSAPLAHAETPDEILKRGLALYKDGKYSDAVVVLAQAYALDPKPETLFPLAQAERISGDCKAAAEHYKKILEQVADLNVAKLVRQNLALCEGSEPPPAAPAAPKCEAPPPAPERARPPAPEIVHDSQTDRVAVISAGAGALALGVATGLYFAASSTRDAADQAGSLAAHDTLADRADAERTATVVTASIGVAAIGFATYRWLTHHDAPRTDIAIVPTTRGGAVWFTSRW
jgi:tetratricopeptide (TPR) repeat protein